MTRIYPGPCKSPHLDMVTIKATDAFSKADSCHFFTHDHCKPENVRSKHQHPKILFDTVAEHIISGAIVQLGQSFDTDVRLSAVRGDIWQYEGTQNYHRLKFCSETNLPKTLSLLREKMKFTATIFRGANKDPETACYGFLQWGENYLPSCILFALR